MAFQKPGPNKRVGGFMIDLAGVTILSVAYKNFTGAELPYILFAAYWLLHDAFGGQSLGKIILGMEIINDKDQPCSFVQGLLRNISLAIPFVVIIEYFVLLFNKQGRRLGDILAKTRVNDINPKIKEGICLVISIGIMIALLAVFYIMNPPQLPAKPA